MASDATDCDSSLLNQQQFQGLVSQSLTFLQEILADEAVPPQERAQIALKILALSQGESSGQNGRSPQLLAENLIRAGSNKGQYDKAVQLASPANGRDDQKGNGDRHSAAVDSAAVEANRDVDHGSAGQQSMQGAQQESSDAIAPEPVSWDAYYTSMLPPRCVKIDNFLSKKENEAALKIAFDNKEKFVGSSTTTNADDYRRSSILYATHYTDFYHLLRKRLLKMMPTIMGQLDSDPFLVSQVEMQMTAHNDGCFYKIHNDSGSPETATRVLTYVYYFYQKPKAYSGGALRIYETDLHGPATEPSEKFNDVIPDNNTMVLFDSRIKHEVREVACPSRKFENSRFTLNGWLRRV
ncbi:MAG: 2OG-Fe(II) oxygenase [Cyanophyceae cyanobacterium]